MNEREKFAEYINTMIEYCRRRNFDDYTPKEAVLEILKAVWADIVSGEDFDSLIKDLQQEMEP